MNRRDLLKGIAGAAVAPYVAPAAEWITPQLMGVQMAPTIIMGSHRVTFRTGLPEATWVSLRDKNGEWPK